jgi:putative ABC transport system substrate-binding protein
VRIGWITLGPHPFIANFREGMRALGYVEGQTYLIEERYADGDARRLPSLAQELAQLPVDIFFASGATPARAVAALTHTIPVVMVGADPISAGLAESLARPGRNATDLDLVSAELAQWS